MKIKLASVVFIIFALFLVKISIADALLDEANNNDRNQTNLIRK